MSGDEAVQVLEQVADASDRATLAEEIHRRDALTRRRPQPVGGEPGKCAWCGAETALGLKFCDIDCRDDWERKHGKN